MTQKQIFLDTLQAIMALRLASNYDAASAYLSPDIVVEFPLSRRLFMWAGRHEGIAQVMEALRMIDAEIRIVDEEMRDCICEGDKMVVRSFRKIANRGSSGIIGMEVSDYFEWKDSRLVRFIEHFDTDAVLRLVRGE